MLLLPLLIDYFLQTCFFSTGSNPQPSSAQVFPIIDLSNFWSRFTVIDFTVLVFLLKHRSLIVITGRPNVSEAVLSESNLPKGVIQYPLKHEFSEPIFVPIFDSE